MSTEATYVNTPPQPAYPGTAEQKQHESDVRDHQRGASEEQTWPILDMLDATRAEIDRLRGLIALAVKSDDHADDCALNHAWGDDAVCDCWHATLAAEVPGVEASLHADEG